MQKWEREIEEILSGSPDRLEIPDFLKRDRKSGYTPHDLQDTPPYNQSNKPQYETADPLWVRQITDISEGRNDGLDIPPFLRLRGYKP